MTATTATKPKRSKRRQTLDDFAELQASRRKLSELREQLSAVERRRRDLMSQPARSTQADAQRLLDGEDLDDDDRQDAKALRDANRRRKALRLAVDEQHRRVRADQHAAAKEILADRQPEYTAIVREIVEAVPQLAALLKAEQDWRRSQMDELKVTSFDFPTAPINPLLGAINEWQSQAVEDGLIDGADVVEIDDVRLQLW